MKSRAMSPQLILCLFTFFTTTVFSSQAAERPGAAADLVTTNPHLKQYVFEEDDTKIRFGFGFSPLLVMRNKAGVSLSIFQIHWQQALLDWEVFNASFGRTVSGDELSKMNSFHFRSSPKFRITDTLSIGPMVGLEFVSFPEVKAKINKNNFFTPDEPFSSRGYTYGFTAAQTVKLGGTQLVRITEAAYRQTYDVVNSGDNGWTYFYLDNELNRDPTPIKPGTVFLVEISFLY